MQERYKRIRYGADIGILIIVFVFFSEYRFEYEYLNPLIIFVGCEFGLGTDSDICQILANMSKKN